MITAMNPRNSHIVTRNSSHFKQFPHNAEVPHYPVKEEDEDNDINRTQSNSQKSTKVNNTNNNNHKHPKHRLMILHQEKHIQEEFADHQPNGSTNIR